MNGEWVGDTGTEGAPEDGDIPTSPRPPVWSTSGAWLRAGLIVLLAWAVTGIVAGVSYLALEYVFVPIMVGVALGLGFVVAVLVAHQARWLGLLTMFWGVFVLVGAVQYAPEAVLERRGVQERVTIVEKRADSIFVLRREDGGRLDEPLEYLGDDPPYRVGDRLTIVRDPQGVVPLADVEKVDPAQKRTMLIMGAAGWSLLGLYAVRRGHVRRRRLAATAA